MASRKRLPYRSLIVVLMALGLGLAWLDQPRPTEAASADLRRWIEAASANLPASTAASTSTARGRSLPRSRGCGHGRGVQIVRNIVDRKTDDSTTSQ